MINDYNVFSKLYTKEKIKTSDLFKKLIFLNKFI